jgi:uncharacterized protein
MAESRSDQEPSIEEILASIREIISDDDAQAQKVEAAPAPAPEPAPAPAPEPEPAPVEDDILDLAAFAEEQKPMKSIEDNADPLAGIDLQQSKVMTVDFTEPEPEPIPEPEPEPVPEPKPAPIQASMSHVSMSNVSMPAIDPDSLLTDNAKAASLDSLTRLAQNIAISRAGNGGTLEDIVREMIKPMLRDWLDRNLPPMIERMVERELERMVKQAMDR